MKTERGTASVTLQRAPIQEKFFSLEMILATVLVVSAMFLVATLIVRPGDVAIALVMGVVVVVSAMALIVLLMNPEQMLAHQSYTMLDLASRTLACIRSGVNETSAQEVCELLLPATAAVAVAITDCSNILGYAGIEHENHPVGSHLRTRATLETLADGKMRVLLNAQDIGFTTDHTRINGAIVVPLVVGDKVHGTLKFYYRSPRQINETQKSIAEGLAQLLSTQIAAAALDEQTKLATSMKLKALQSQINPHFLFNTINTIASLIRTNPDKARVLLREFAVFYRRTLEDSEDLIMLERELEQTARYFSFEIARFGEERVKLEEDVQEEAKTMLVPPFLIQPLVENAVHHGMPSEGQLVVQVLCTVEGSDVIVRVRDNGVGMSEEARLNILHPEATTGMGIAVRNVHDRMVGYFGPGTCMDVESAPGEGTTITLVLKDCAIPAPVQELSEGTASF